jgi:hypothetical protein
MVADEGPARQQQITVSTGLDVDVELIHSVGKFQAFSKKFWLVIEPTSANVTIHFLQADDVWRLRCDHVHNPLKPVSPVASTYPFMNIVTQQSQRMSPIRQLRRFCTQRFSIAPAFTEFSQGSIASHQGYLRCLLDRTLQKTRTLLPARSDVRHHQRVIMPVQVSWTKQLRVDGPVES